MAKLLPYDVQPGDIYVTIHNPCTYAHYLVYKVVEDPENFPPFQDDYKGQLKHPIVLYRYRHYGRKQPWNEIRAELSSKIYDRQNRSPIDTYRAENPDHIMFSDDRRIHRCNDECQCDLKHPFTERGVNFYHSL